MVASSLADLRAISARLGAEQQVAFASMPPNGWRFDDDGVLRHEQSDYFDIVGVVSRDGTRNILLRQPETALVGLVVTRVGGVRHALLTAKCEPGLHGGCQFSTTVQATPSNYLRRHGGAPTPHLDLVLNPLVTHVTLHDSIQFDWGQYYLGKTKRFVIIEIDSPVDAIAPAVWVPEPVLVELLTADFAVTTDLRAILPILLAHDQGVALDDASASRIDIDRARQLRVSALEHCDLREVSGWDAATNEASVMVRSIDVASPSREVGDWQQPLLDVAAPLASRLPIMPVGISPDGEVRFGIHARTALGLREVALWYPADEFASSSPEATVSSVRTSAEGARFLHHEVTLELAFAAEGASRATEVDAVPGLVQWVTLPELVALCVRDECTSVELRLALSLAIVSGAVLDARA